MSVITNTITSFNVFIRWRSEDCGCDVVGEIFIDTKEYVVNYSNQIMSLTSALMSITSTMAVQCATVTCNKQRRRYTDNFYNTKNWVILHFIKTLLNNIYQLLHIKIKYVILIATSSQLPCLKLLVCTFLSC